MAGTAHAVDRRSQAAQEIAGLKEAVSTIDRAMDKVKDPKRRAQWAEFKKFLDKQIEEMEARSEGDPGESLGVKLPRPPGTGRKPDRNQERPPHAKVSKYDDGAPDAGSPTAKLFLEEKFTGAKFDSKWQGKWVDQKTYRQHEQEVFRRMGEQGEVLHYYIPQGANELTPASVGVYGSEGFRRVTGKEHIDEVFIQWKEFFPEGHDFADGSQKLLRFAYYQPGESKGTELNWWVQSDNGNLQLYIAHPGVEGEARRDFAVNLGKGIPTGSWVTFGVWCKLNTPGESDGFARVYMNGERVISKSNLNLRGKDKRGWNQMWIGGVHSNRGPTTQASSRFIDDIRWYSTKPKQAE